MTPVSQLYLHVDLKLPPTVLLPLLPPCSDDGSVAAREAELLVQSWNKTRSSYLQRGTPRDLSGSRGRPSSGLWPLPFPCLVFPQFLDDHLPHFRNQVRSQVTRSKTSTQRPASCSARTIAGSPARAQVICAASLLTAFSLSGPDVGTAPTAVLSALTLVPAV